MAAMHDAEELTFGRFRLRRAQRLLLADGRPVELGQRAIELLLALIDAHGAPLGKDELLERVWPGMVVEEHNLTVQIHTLRAALGPDRDLIRTIPRRGYCFTGAVTTADAASPLPAAASPAPARPAGTNLPAFVGELIGRDAEMAELLRLQETSRLLTLIGPGGIGKSRLALGVAQQALPRFPDGVWLVEFAPLADPELVPGTIAAALGLQLDLATPSAARVAVALAQKRMLLVLDNCEHVILQAARAAEALLHAAAGVHLLATSREPLRADGETIYQVPALAMPEPEMTEADAILRHGAPRLFVTRVRAADARFAPDAERAVTIGAICRRLDGMPLAIELAASRAAALGVQEVADRLDDRFALLTGGHRTALPRHQTLRAALDWSHELLAEPERVLLRRLAIFVGGFSLEAATAVAAMAGADGPRIEPAAIIDGISGLIAKSLVTFDLAAGAARYGLLETTRAYALERLAESGEREPVARRHAGFFRTLFARAEAEAASRPGPEWLAEYGRWIDNLRAALDWAFSPSGDPAIGVALTVSSVPLWVQWSLLGECRVWVERALASAAPDQGPDEGRMKLLAALGAALTYTQAPALETGENWTRVLAIAESLGDIGYQLQALRGLWIFRLSRGGAREGLGLAQRFAALAATTGDPGDRSMARRMLGVSQHYLGEFAAARDNIEAILRDPPGLLLRSNATRVLIDQPITAQSLRARALWIQGFPELAMRAAQQVVADARAIEHGLPLCHALAQGACPVAIYSGDFAAAGRWAAMLIEHTMRHGLAGWTARARCLQGSLLARGGDPEAGLAVLRDALQALGRSGLGMNMIAYLGEFAAALGHTGAAAEAASVIDEALARSERDGERWCIAELLRTKGELLAQADPAAAASLFGQSLDWARRQGALSWELRTATSLVRLRRDGAARERLATIYARFTEGFATADLRAAKQALEAPA